MVIIAVGEWGGNNVCYIYSDNAGTPGALMATATSELGGSGFATYYFSTPVGIVNGLTYWVVFKISDWSLTQTSYINQAATGFFSAYGANLAALVPNAGIGANNNFCLSLNCVSY